MPGVNAKLFAPSDYVPPYLKETEIVSGIFQEQNLCNR
jgi:hypothetical protein